MNVLNFDILQLIEFQLQIDYGLLPLYQIMEVVISEVKVSESIWHASFPIEAVQEQRVVSIHFFQPILLCFFPSERYH